jgi:hypothetical protein
MILVAVEPKHSVQVKILLRRAGMGECVLVRVKHSEYYQILKQRNVVKLCTSRRRKWKRAHKLIH